jgi:hypothetical protein
MKCRNMALGTGQKEHIVKENKENKTRTEVIAPKNEAKWKSLSVEDILIFIPVASIDMVELTQH